MCTGLEPLLFGTAATGTAAATTGLIGTAGAFAAAPALMTAGTVLSMAGQISQGQQQKEMYNTQAQQNLNDAAYREDAYKEQAQKFRKAGKIQLGEANASLAASGVKLGEGTPLEIQKSIAQGAESDALSAILSGKRISTSAQQEASLLGKSADNSVTNSILGATSTALMAGSKFAKGGWKGFDMPKIPIGDFGRSIVQPAPTVRIPMAAFDTGGSGAQKLGDTGIRAAGSIMDEQRQEAERLALEKQHQDAALVRAKAANVMLDREIAVDAIGKDIEQQVSTGAIHYDDAPSAYKQRIADLGTPEVSSMDPVTAENFGRGLKRLDFKGESFIGGVVAKAKIADLRAQADGLLDKLGKQAGLPGTDMSSIQAQADALDEIGTRAYGAAWGKRKQDWTDNTWDARLNQQAMAVRNDLTGMQTLEKSITEGEYADKLDSNRRNALVSKLAGYRTSLIQRNEAAAARAQREQERLLKKAEAAFNTFQALADKGTILAPEYIDQAVHSTSGTPYQHGIRALAQQSQEAGGIASQPVATQQALLDKLDAQIATQGRTPALDKRREQIDKVLRASQDDLKDNGLRAGLERGVIADMAPIDVSTPQAIAASVAKRLEQAQTVSMWAGKAVSPLDAREAGQLRDMLGALPPKQRAEAVATLSDALGARFASAVADQIDKHDRALSLAFAVGGDKTPAQTSWFGMKKSDERLTSELILKGATAIKDGAVMKDDKKVTGWKATIASEVDGLFPDERLATAAKDSAYYIAAGIAQENGGSVSPSELRRAVRLAVGGDIIERNGKKLPIPAGMDASTFEDRLRTLSASGIAKQAPDGKVRVAGVDMPVSDFASTIAGQELMPAGPGRYAVIVRGRPVMNTAGRPIIVEVR